MKAGNPIPSPDARRAGPNSPIRMRSKPALFRDCLIIDGPARVGKLFAAALISNLDRVDWAYHSPVIENIGILWRMGLLDRDTAVGLLSLHIDSTVYDPAVGRHLNMRPTDKLSVYGSLRFKEIQQRRLDADGDEAVDRYNAAGTIPCLVCHDSVPNSPVFFEAVPNLRFLYLARNPIDAAFSWVTQGWGERHGVDPRSFSPTFDVDGETVPWWAADWAGDYATMPPAERAVRGYLHVEEAYARAVAGLTADQKDRVLAIPYEGFVERTETQLQKVAAFLGTEVPAGMKIGMARENVPRALPAGQREERMAEIRSHVPVALSDRLAERARAYEAEWDPESVDA